jgi:hypothetical protein
MKRWSKFSRLKICSKIYFKIDAKYFFCISYFISLDFSTNYFGKIFRRGKRTKHKIFKMSKIFWFLKICFIIIASVPIIYLRKSSDSTYFSTLLREWTQIKQIGSELLPNQKHGIRKTKKQLLTMLLSRKWTTNPKSFPQFAAITYFVDRLLLFMGAKGRINVWHK